jgi:hypothetical protein
MTPDGQLVERYYLLVHARAFARLLCAPGVAAALALAACASVPKGSASMQASPEVILTASELQLRAFEMGRNLSARIEGAADAIVAESADPAVRRNALLWKISAIPLVQEAAVRNDPQVAAADLVAYTMQQLDYLTTGSGRSSFGPQQAIAVDATLEAQRQTIAFASSAFRGGKLPASAEANLREWAAANPMSGPSLRRASILASDWKALGLSDTSLAATLGSVDRTIANISYRLSYLRETLAAEARWNAELAAEDALRAPQIDSLFGTGTATLHSVGTLADDTPALVDREREAVMADIDRERVALMGDIGRERAVIMSDLDRERVAVMIEINRQRELAFQDLAAQRVALQAVLTSERKAVMERLGQERIAAFQSADGLAQHSIEGLGSMLRRITWEIILGALLVVAALLGSALVLIHRWRATAAGT